MPGAASKAKVYRYRYSSIEIHRILRIAKSRAACATPPIIGLQAIDLECALCWLPHIQRGHAELIFRFATFRGTSMPNAIPCPDCIDLVGADADREPHGTLVPLEKESEAKGAFQCGACQTRWSVESLGWSREVG